MNKTNLLWGALIFGAVFLFGCSSQQESDCACNENPGSSNSVSSSSGVKNSSSSTHSSSSSSSVNYVEDQDLVRKNVTLSSEKSYADIDGEPVAYTEDEASNNLKKIDLVAYCGIGYCESNSIYSPWEIKLFYDKTGFLGEYVYIYEIPKAKAEIFKTAKTLYEILGTWNDLTVIFNDTDSIDEISIEAGKVFFIATSENKYNVVIIKEEGDQSVDLEIVEIPILGH